MSAINSSLTDAQIQAAYEDNASYAEENSVAKCKLFLTAARILLIRLPEEFGTRHSTTKFRMDLIQKEIESARAWLAANDTSSTGTSGPSYVRVDLSRSRD